MTKFSSILPDLKSSISRLEEVLQISKTDITRDSAIKRFEMAFDLAWKTLKAYLEEQHNVREASPKMVFREAFNKKVITDYDEFWIKLVDLRNETVHTYKQDLAESLYEQLPKALEYFKKLLETLES